MSYFIAFVIVYILRVLLRLNWWITGALFVFAVVMVPKHRKRYEKAAENQRRFYDVSLYLDTLLYSFVKEEKVELAIRDVSQTLSEGRLKTLVQNSYDYLQMTFDEVAVLEEGLSKIEREYSCQRIRTVHQFMCHVEFYGGEIEKPINLLLADKSRWEKRVKEALVERKKQMVDILLSVAASVCICAAILSLPVMDMDISKEWVVQIASFLVIAANDLIVLKAQGYLGVDWLQVQLSEDESYYVQKMEALREYQEEKEKKRSKLLGSMGIAAAAVCFFLQKEWLVVFCLLLSLFLFQQHRIGKNLLRNNLIKEIKHQFPNWLLDLVLLLQSENVQVALQKSKEHVPGVLRKELHLLTERLAMQPEASAPYHAFLKEFDIPEVHSAMGILYSLSIGNSGNADKQINELVEKNLEMLDVTETELLKNAAAGMYVLFLLPVVTASFKLLVDMVLLMLRFISMPMV